jgi:HK97 family phage prohead protease
MPEGDHMNTKRFSASVKAAGPGDGLEEGQFTAYASTFNGEPDSYGDVVAPGAFAKSIAEWEASGNVMPTLYGHDFADPFKNIGSVLEATEDDHGLLVKTQLDLDNPTAAQVYRLIKGRRLSQMSFAFDTLDEGQVDVNGQKANELRELKLYEVSVVPIGANQETEILAVKAAASSLLDGIKEGRTISSRTSSQIQESIAGISESLSALTAASARLKELLPAEPDAQENDQEVTSTSEPVKEASKSASQEPTRDVSVNGLAEALIQLKERNHS